MRWATATTFTALRAVSPLVFSLMLFMLFITSLPSSHFPLLVFDQSTLMLLGIFERGRIQNYFVSRSDLSIKFRIQAHRRITSSWLEVGVSSIERILSRQTSSSRSGNYKASFLGYRMSFQVLDLHRNCLFRLFNDRSQWFSISHNSFQWWFALFSFNLIYSGLGYLWIHAWVSLRWIYS